MFLCVSFVIDIVTDNFISGSQYQILKYKIDDSTENLINLCDNLIVGGDIKFLDYVDILLNREDFEDVYNKMNKDLSWEKYNDLLILQTFKCIIQSDESNELEETVINYFPKVKMSDPLAHLSYALGKKTKVANENKINIINGIIRLYNFSSGDEKQKYLEYIVAYYSYYDINNEASQLYIDELNNLVKDMKNYEKKFCYSNVEFSKSCWEYMFTGTYNEEIVNYYDIMFLDEFKQPVASDGSVIEP